MTFVDLFILITDSSLKVTDSTKKVGEFEDVSKVEKFELSEEEYAKRNG